MPKRANHAPAADRPTVDFAILATLRRRGPLSGYAVTQVLRDAAAFWSAPHSQVYPRLAALEADGLVGSTSAPGRGPLPNKSYRVTDKGRRALRRWVSQEPEPRVARDELALKMWAGLDVDPDEVIRLLADQRDQHARRLEQYQKWLAELLADGAPSPQTAQFGSWAALRRGIGVEQAFLAWCDELTAALARTAVVHPVRKRRERV